MFKDLMKAILNEDVEEEMDDEEVQEEIQEQPVYQEPVISPVKTYTEPEVSVFSTPKVQPKPEVKSSIFSGLDVEEVSRQETRAKNKPYKYDRRKMMKLRSSEDENYSPIISPIFGDIKEEKKEFDKVHDAIKLPKPTDDTSFVTIISPMYGSNIPKAKAQEKVINVKPSFKKKEENEKPESLNLSDVLEKEKVQSQIQEDLFKMD